MIDRTDTPLRVAFMGSPDFAVPTLKALLERGHNVVCVYSQPPRPAGRGKKERLTAVHQAALEAGIEVRTPRTLRDADAVDAFRALDLDVAVVAAYGLILPRDILNAPRLGCLNVHASLLPRWRGAAPIHRAVLAGDPESGVTIMQMSEGLDEGPILTKARVPISALTTSASLHDALAALGGPLLVETMEGLAEGRVTAEPQDAAGVTYAAKLSKSEAALDWTKSAEELDRQTRAFTPWPGATFSYGGEVIKLLSATPGPVPEKGDGATPLPGTVLDDALTIACGEGVLRLTRLQRPGRKPLEAEDFLRGLAIAKGDRLG